MIKIYKDNQILSINDTELEYYKSLGFKKVGEKETSEKGVSLAKYNKLMDENNKMVAELEEANKKLVALTSEKETLEKSLEEANKTISKSEKSNKKEGE